MIEKQEIKLRKKVLVVLGKAIIMRCSQASLGGKLLFGGTPPPSPLDRTLQGAVLEMELNSCILRVKIAFVLIAVASII